VTSNRWQSPVRPTRPSAREGCVGDGQLRSFVAPPELQTVQSRVSLLRPFLRAEWLRFMAAHLGGTCRGLPESRLTRRISVMLLLGQVICSTGCGGAPSVTIAGAYFPAWLLCAIIAVLVATFIRALMVATRLANQIPYQLAVCCSTGVIVALILWHLWVGR
jgi:hypothetical protein